MASLGANELRIHANVPFRHYCVIIHDLKIDIKTDLMCAIRNIGLDAFCHLYRHTDGFVP